MARRIVQLFMPRRGLAVVVLISAAVLVLILGARCVDRGGGARGLSTPPVAVTPGPMEVATPSDATATPKLKPTWTPNVGPDCMTPHPLPTVDVQSLPDGGTAYVYDTNGDGVGDAWVNVPPSNFDAATASEADLERYGIPPRPTDPDALAEWSKAWNAKGHWSHSLGSGICVSAG